MTLKKKKKDKRKEERGTAELYHMINKRISWKDDSGQDVSHLILNSLQYLYKKCGSKIRIIKYNSVKGICHKAYVIYAYIYSQEHKISIPIL